MARKPDLEMIDQAMRNAGLNPGRGSLREQIHQAITGKHYSKEEIQEIVNGYAEMLKSNQADGVSKPDEGDE